MKVKIGEYTKGKRLPNSIECELSEIDCAKGFGISLRRLRKFKNLTLDELSEKVEIPNPTLNRYESGYNLPSIFYGMKIADFFGTDIEKMIMCGIAEMKDIDDKMDTAKYQYIEQFVLAGDKLKKVLGVKTKLTFNDHKKPQRKGKK